MKDIRSVTLIVKKRKEKKRGQCVIRKNGAINTLFLHFSWLVEHHRKKGESSFSSLKERKKHQISKNYTNLRPLSREDTY
jgi:hypothetical protein